MPTKCSNCNGKGKWWSNASCKDVECYKCKGIGQIPDKHDSICPECGKYGTHKQWPAHRAYRCGSCGNEWDE